MLQAKKKSLLIVIFFISVVYAEFFFLNKYINKHQLRAVYEAQFAESELPVFTFGYKRYLLVKIENVSRAVDLNCASFFLKITHSGSQVYYEIEALCDSKELKSEELALNAFHAKNIEEINSHTQISGGMLISKQYKNHQDILGKNNRLLVLTAIFALSVILSFPWCFYNKSKD